VIRRLWLLRHAESKAQTGEDATIDPDLTPRGEAQAARVANALADIPFDRIMISPLRRARRTFELSGLPREKASLDSRLLEWTPDPTDYQELLPCDVGDSELAGDVHNAWTIPFDERLQAVLREVTETEEENLLLVSHFGYLSALLKYFMIGRHEQDFPRCATANTGISVLAFGPESGRKQVLRWNDDSHVRDLIDER
jgi:broad specificity phosphatase PhoE